MKKIKLIVKTTSKKYSINIGLNIVKLTTIAAKTLKKDVDLFLHLDL